MGVRDQSGELVSAKRAVLADASTSTLYRQLVGLPDQPPAFGAALDTFQWDNDRETGLGVVRPDPVAAD